jgi:hypothetical protein
LPVEEVEVALHDDRRLKLRLVDRDRPRAWMSSRPGGGRFVRELCGNRATEG